jgi:hypothetical protein
VVNETKAVLDYIAARQASHTNYYTLSSTSLDPTFKYGSTDQPAVVEITDSSLKLNSSLTGVGILVVPNDFEINAALNWTGIVVVHPSPGMTAGQVLINNSGATGGINGALMLQSGTQFVLTTNSGGANLFSITYSCDAIDVAMGSQPLKVVAHSESSH